MHETHSWCAVTLARVCAGARGVALGLLWTQAERQRSNWRTSKDNSPLGFVACYLLLLTLSTWVEKYQFSQHRTSRLGRCHSTKLTRCKVGFQSYIHDKTGVVEGAVAQLTHLLVLHDSVGDEDTFFVPSARERLPILEKKNPLQ